MDTDVSSAAPGRADRWDIDASGAGIVWDLADDARLPHADHVEMSGRRVSLIARYGVDADRRLTLTREVIWPTLRTRPGDVRGYLRRTYEDAPEAVGLTVDGEAFTPGLVRSIRFDGVLSIAYEPADGLAVTRSVFPSVAGAAVIDAWRVENTGSKPRRVSWPHAIGIERQKGVYGVYRISVVRDTPPDLPTLEPGEAVLCQVAIHARREADVEEEGAEAETVPGCAREAEQRRARCEALTGRATLTVETPDPVLNAAFRMAKLRAGESLFETANLGLVHSPGGGRYYGGVWANDQAEYSGPLFAYLGDADAQTAAENAYRAFARAMTPEYATLPSSFEVEGTVAWGGAGDRGDAAMIAGGLSRYLLARGDRPLAEEFWPAVAWCLEYVRRKTRRDGVVASDSDELEGRFSSGDANLSTSCLAFDALRRAADLARSLEKPDEAAEYDRRADALATAIEDHFGATVEGYETYRYHDGNTTLRAWVCLPLCFGLAEVARLRGTIDALFSPRLWTPDGLATEAGDKVFWDRSTLYALRGVFAAGETETALRYLTAFSRRRLLGDHVPYPVEAYPEGGQAHLSAESALYCRVFAEGILGLLPTGFRSFAITPRLPREWPEMTFRLPDAFGERGIEIRVERVENGLRTRVRTNSDGDILDAVAAEGMTHAVTLTESKA